MKLTFTNRTDFEKAHSLIFSSDIRQNSTKDLKVESYADMIIYFEDDECKYMINRAVQKLKENEISSYLIS